jgi:hypothetical protein
MHLKLLWQGSYTYPSLDEDGTWSHPDPVLNAILNAGYGPDPERRPTPEAQLAAAAERFEALIGEPPPPPLGPVFRSDREARSERLAAREAPDGPVVP